MPAAQKKLPPWMDKEKQAPQKKSKSAPQRASKKPMPFASSGTAKKGK